LPAHIGTTTLAAEVYCMQKDLGLTNPEEKFSIEHVKDYQVHIPLALNDLRLQK
jgi:hypothetical protein